jgi:hypothetical protein
MGSLRRVESPAFGRAAGGGEIVSVREYTPVTTERVRNELIPKELDGARGAKECAIT